VTRQVLRKSDFSLADEQQAVREAFAEFFEKESPPARVRGSEPLGFDRELWEQLVGLGGLTMGLPVEAGGDGAGLVELALVAEEHGRRLAPVPFVDAAVAARLLARVGGAEDWLAGVVGGSRLVTVSLRPGAGHQLVPAGAVCDGVIGHDGSSLVLVADDTPPPLVPNHGSAPVAWWDLSGSHGSRVALRDGTEAASLHRGAVGEWKLLTAAALVGLSSGVLDMAAEHARTRYAFGVPIGSFQGVSHRLADVLIGVEGARRLVWKAAWFADHEPHASPRLLTSAWIHACDVATKAVTQCLHVHGGVGFTLESDVQLFFRRAKGWTALAGDPRRDLQELAALVAPTYEVNR
jgi:alkylation response protein AidB-like acyl-CoA dehydrogenase